MLKKEINADEQEAFIREVTEEVKNDNLKQMWEKYGIYIILLVVLSIVGAVSFEGFKSWRKARSETWSDTYAYALNLENQGKIPGKLRNRAILPPHNGAEENRKPLWCGV